MPGSVSSAGSRRHLDGIAEIRTFFRTNQQPIYFVGPTAFNLLGIDRWVRNFQYIAYYDSWDGRHPRVFTPENRPYVEFESSEEINNYLLRDPEVRDYLRRRGGTPMVAMVFFDAETEEICREQGYELILPPDELRRRLDSKIVTTQLGNEAGAPSVPNVLGHASSYETLLTLAAEAGLGVGTLYRHFPTREALIDVLIAERLERLLTSTQTAVNDVDPWAAVEDLVWRFAAFEAEDRGMADILAEQYTRTGRAAPGMAALLEHLGAVMARAQAAGAMRQDVSAEDVVFAVCGVGKMMRPDDDPGRWQRLVGVFLDGLRGAAASDRLSSSGPASASVD